MGGKCVGATLVELVVALVCGVLIIQLGLRSLAHARTVEADLKDRSERLAALRITRTTLRQELRVGVGGRDWVPFVPDSVKLRAFRGAGAVCPSSSTDTLLVGWRGTRQPDASKDSVLLLDDRGRWRAHDLVSVSGGSARCGADSTAAFVTWIVTPPPARSIVLARLFESGSYHLAGGALRYRRGRSGRQPLTPDVLQAPPSGIFDLGDHLELRVQARGSRWAHVGYLIHKSANGRD